jgi:hypothetical protein
MRAAMAGIFVFGPLLAVMDGAVLFVTGQYLYDYQEITEDPELIRIGNSV